MHRVMGVYFRGDGHGLRGEQRTSRFCNQGLLEQGNSTWMGVENRSGIEYPLGKNNMVVWLSPL